MPSDSEIAWARAILEQPDGASAIDGAMIDRPVRERAAYILSRGE
jgi:citrate lyase beta subunit